MDKEEDDFITCDLHVHTPASKCYKGKKTDDEYIDILKRYYDKNISVIAITDHNTISGYQSLLRLKDSFNQRKDVLLEYLPTHPDLQVELDAINKYLSYFNKMLIIPGVEFEANPGIHLLFLFNPNTDTNEIENLLVESGYTKTDQGSESPENVNIDVLEALERAKKMQAITIAAHVDSTKGIYSALDKNHYRARIFSSDNLDAISVNSIVTIEKIKGLLNQEEYKRTRPLAIIQSSDHHQESDCGKMFSYFKMSSLLFDELAKCIADPNEMISTTAKPKTVNIIKQIAHDNNTICLETVDQEIFGS